MALLGAVASCATPPPQSPSASTCAAAAPACPLSIAFAAGRTHVSGALSPQRMSQSYTFTTTEPARLKWSMSGVGTRTVLTYPDGNSDGPGLDSVIALSVPGRYVFTVSANTMAENIYGRFRLDLELLTPH